MDFMDTTTFLPRYRDVTCYSCHERGHYAAECPHHFPSKSYRTRSGTNSSVGSIGGGGRSSHDLNSSLSAAQKSQVIANETRPIERSRMPYRRRTCRYWLNGNCRQGIECPFGHDFLSYDMTGGSAGLPLPLGNGRNYLKTIGYGVAHPSMHHALYGPPAMMYPPRLPTHAPYTSPADYGRYMNHHTMSMTLPRSYHHSNSTTEEMKDEMTMMMGTGAESEGMRMNENENENGMGSQYSTIMGPEEGEGEGEEQERAERTGEMGSGGHGQYYAPPAPHPMGMPTPPLPPYSQYPIHPYLLNTSPAMMHHAASSYGMPYMNYHHFSQPMQQPPFKPSTPSVPPAAQPQSLRAEITKKTAEKEEENAIFLPPTGDTEENERGERHVEMAIELVSEQEKAATDVVDIDMRDLQIKEVPIPPVESELMGKTETKDNSANEGENTAGDRSKEKRKIQNGLSNDTGQNNCFLNVVVQALFHSSKFQHLFSAITDHECPAPENCVTCVLRMLFTQLADENARNDISSTPLRDLLCHTSSSTATYMAGSMDDAAEAFEIILNLLHQTLTLSKEACSFRSVMSRHQNQCLVHECFGMYFKENAVCPRCHQSIKGIKYEAITRFFSATVLYGYQKENTASTQVTMAKASTDTTTLNFSQMLAKTLVGDSKKCHNFHCVNNKPIQSHIQLVSLPQVLCIGLSWPSVRPKTDMLRGITKAISAEIVIDHLFKDSDPRFQYMKGQLNSMICYSGHHYIVLIYENEEWYFFDDQKIYTIGSDFKAVIDICDEGHFQPLLLLYTLFDDNTKMKVSSTSSNANDTCLAKEDTKEKETFEFMIGDIMMTVSKEENEQRWKHTSKTIRK